MKDRIGKTRPFRARGISLAETLLASAILAMTVVAVSMALVAGTEQTWLTVDARRGAELAEAMLEEILTLPYDDPEAATTIGPDAGETTRAAFDNIDDYHGLTEAAGSVTDKAGTAYPEEYGRFTRSVTAAAGSMQPAGFANAVTGLTLTVTVTCDGWTVAQLTRFVPDPET